MAARPPVAGAMVARPVAGAMGADLADSPAAVSMAADLAGSTAPVSIGPDPQVISSGCRPWQPEETIGLRPVAIAPLRSTAISHEVTNTLSKQRFDDHAVGCCGPRDVQHVLDRFDDGQCRSLGRF
jgi:hypothetical protein